MSFTVADVLQEVRTLIQFSNQSNMPDSTILKYLNRWWQISLPQGFTHFALKSEYSFLTVQGQSNYPFPIDLYLNETGIIYCDALPMKFYQDPNAFANVYNTNRTNATAAYGDGTKGIYEGTLTNVPLISGYSDAFGILHSQVYFKTTAAIGTPITLYDNGVGGLEGDGTGSINYATGAYTLLFDSDVLEGAPIYVNSTYYAQGRPFSVLFFQNTFTLRSVPDRPYLISCNTYLVPSYFTSVTQEIPIAQYFDIMARGTALRIATTLKDEYQVRFLKGMYDESMVDVQNITTRQRGNQRPSTQFYNPNPYTSVNQAWANNPAPMGG